MRQQRLAMTAWHWVLLGGLVAGTLDIIFATSFWAAKGVPSIRILQSIAAGVLGAEARQGGAASASLGAALHYLIAITMAAVYYLASRRWQVLVQRAVPFGLAYGLVLYAVMRYVVVPLSAVPAAQASPQDSAWIVGSIAAHMLLVGLPCALFARRAQRVAPAP